MFFLLKAKIKPYISTLKLVFWGLILLQFLLLFFVNLHYRNEIKKYKDNQQIVEQLEKTHKAELTAQKVEIERDWAQQRIKANEEYTAEIKRIHDQHIASLHNVSSMQFKTSEIIKHLPDYSRTAVEKVASTSANSFIECSTLLVEVDAVARWYSAEIDELIKGYPRVEVKELANEADK